jgi:hypothetical protein
LCNLTQTILTKVRIVWRKNVINLREREVVFVSSEKTILIVYNTIVICDALKKVYAIKEQ